MHVTFLLYTQVEIRPKMEGESWWSQERKWLKFHTWRPLPADEGRKQPKVLQFVPNKGMERPIHTSVWLPLIPKGEWVAPFSRLPGLEKISQHDQTSRLPRDRQILSSSICWYSLSCSTLKQFQPNQKHPCLSPVPYWLSVHLLNKGACGSALGEIPSWQPKVFHIPCCKCTVHRPCWINESLFLMFHRTAQFVTRLLSAGMGTQGKLTRSVRPTDLCVVVQIPPPL